METVKYDKPFKTIDEQIALLKARNLIIADDGFARKALSTVSYYDLINGYQESMMDSGMFKPGVSLEYLFAFHLFDKDFQNIIFKNSALIENLFKTKVSYILSQNLGVELEDYLDPKEYRLSLKTLNFYRLKDEAYKIYMYYDKGTSTWKKKDLSKIHQPTRHYVEHHNHIPPWILMRNLSFSNSINLYRLIKSPHKDMISDLLLPNAHLSPDQKANFLVSAVSLIREFRNQVAHNLKFVTHVSDNYRLPTSETNTIAKSKMVTSGRPALNDMYACIIAMIILLDTKELRVRFARDLITLIDPPFMHSNNAVYTKNFPLFWDYMTVSQLPQDFLKILQDLINGLPG